MNENDNIARNRPAFQSTTDSENSLAIYAVDSSNNINNFSLTSFADGSWFAVDLGQVYLITEICMLNSVDSSKK